MGTYQDVSHRDIHNRKCPSTISDSGNVNEDNFTDI